MRESELYFDPDGAMQTLSADLDARGIHPNEVAGEDVEQDVAHDVSEWAPISVSDAEGLDGLDGANAAELDDVAPHLSSGTRAATRRTSTPGGSGPRPSSTQPELDFASAGPRAHNAVQASDLRACARREGLPAGNRGRLDPTIISLYNGATRKRLSR